MTNAVADTSTFIAQESGRRLGDFPDAVAVSVITAAELELGVLRARGVESRTRRVATLDRIRRSHQLLPVDVATASCFARIAEHELSNGRRLRRHDTRIAATALRHGVPVVTKDAGFSQFELVDVIRV